MSKEVLTDEQMILTFKLVCASFLQEDVSKFSVLIDSVDDEFMRMPVTFNTHTLYLGKFHSRRTWEIAVAILTTTMLLDEQETGVADLSPLAQQVFASLKTEVAKAMRVVALCRQLVPDEYDFMGYSLGVLVERFLEYATMNGEE